MASDDLTADDAPVLGVLGVALAGGASRRMGQEKAALALGGEPLLRRAVERLRLALAEVVVVGPPALAALAPGARVIADEWPGRGPLGALATVLRATDAEWALLVACDMPFIRPALLRELARLALATPDADAIALPAAPHGDRRHAGLEPLHAAYRRACLPAALARLSDPTSGDASLRGLLAELRVRELAPEVARRLDPLNRSTFNANTPAQWQVALRLADEEEQQQAGE